MLQQLLLITMRRSSYSLLNADIVEARSSQHTNGVFPCNKPSCAVKRDVFPILYRPHAPACAALNERSGSLSQQDAGKSPPSRVITR